MSDDTQAIVELVHSYCDAIREGDEGAFRALWTGQDLDTMISIADEYVGPDAVARDFYTGVLHTKYRSIELVEDSEPRVRMLSDGVAIVVFRYHTVCVRAEDGSPYGIAGAETQVVLRTAKGWRIAHIHYSKES